MVRLTARTGVCLPDQSPLLAVPPTGGPPGQERPVPPGPRRPEGPHGGGQVPHPVRLEPAAVAPEPAAGCQGQQEPGGAAGPGGRRQYGPHRGEHSSLRRPGGASGFQTSK